MKDEVGNFVFDFVLNFLWFTFVASPFVGVPLSLELAFRERSATKAERQRLSD